MMPAAGRERVADPRRPVDVAAGREVGPLDDLEQVVDRRRRVLEHEDEPVDDLSQVVRRDVGRHADRDPGRAVHQEVREAGRKHDGLLLGLVVVRDEIDRVPVDIRQHLLGDLRQPDLGVAHRRRRVAVDRAEISLPVDEGVPKGELLRHPHEGLVDRRLAVGVELAERVTDHAGRLAIPAVPRQAHLVHGIEHAAMDRLEAVADVGQRPPDDDGHGVVEVRPPHLVFDGNRQQPLRHQGLLRGPARGRRGGAPGDGYTSMVASSA